MRRFELVDGTSSKFWEIQQAADAALHIRWGRIGTAGQSQTKSFADDAKAQAAMDKLVKEKTTKGYAEVMGAEAARHGGAHGGASAAPQTDCAPPSAPSCAVPADEPQKVQALVVETAVSTPPASAVTTASEVDRAVAPADGVPPWLAHGEPLWMSDFHPLIYASRRYPWPMEPRTLKPAWQRVRSLVCPVEGGPDLDLVFNMDSSAPVFKDPLQRMLDRQHLVEPPSDAEADALLLCLALSSTDFYSGSESEMAIIDYLVARYGLPGAVDVYLTAQKIQVRPRYNAALKKHEKSFSTHVDEPMKNRSRCPFGPGDEILRRYLSEAPLAQWAACAERIEAALPDIHPSRQPNLAMLLPERPDLSNSLLLAAAEMKDPPETVFWLMFTATDPEAVTLAVKLAEARLLPIHRCGFWGDRRMVATHLLERGVDAVGLLIYGAGEEAAGDALTCIGIPEAVAALARVASHSKAALARLALAVKRWPQAAVVGLAREVAKGGKDVGLLTQSLTRLLRAQPELVDPIRPWLDRGAQAVIDRHLDLLTASLDIAAPHDLPSVLASPPWRAQVVKKKQDALVLMPLPLLPVEQWEEGARERALALSPWHRHRFEKARAHPSQLLDSMGFDVNDGGWIRSQDVQQKAHWLAAVGSARALATDAIRREDGLALITSWRELHEIRCRLMRSSYGAPDGFVFTLLPRPLGLAFWNSVAGETETGYGAFVMASLGLAALPGLVSLVRSKPADYLDLAQSFGATELAPMAARAYARLKSQREDGRRWLLRYPEHAACALIAPALGKNGEARDCAGVALRLLQAHGHEPTLRAVAARYGDPAVVQGLDAVLNESALDRFPTRRSKLPDWWQPRGWHRPLLRNGKALPETTLDVVGEMMAFSTTEEVYAGIGVLRQACDDTSLADFAWDAFCAWLEVGGPSKEGWALSALGLLGNDDTARRLTPLIRNWPGEAAHARAVTGLDVLAGIGTDVALMLLNGIAQKIKFKALQDRAREKIQAIAQARGLSTEELEDRLAPDLGLDERGSLVLDFGPRVFRVAFDESLKPCVREMGENGVLGARLSDLPKPKKTDNEAMAKEAVERFKLLKKDARTIASQQLRRLEVAMCARRRWTPELFRLFLVEHPLLRHIVQRLVWGVYEVPDGGNFGGTLRACFRVAEDGSFTTAEDDAFELPEGEQLRIGVLHALETPAADAAAFGQVFADYELPQPFAQIGRDTYTLSDEEKAAVKLLRWSGAKVPTGRVLGLVNKGWRRGQAQDGGCIWHFSKPLGTHKLIELDLDPGIIVGMVDEYPEQTLGEVQVGRPSSWGELEEPDTFAVLDAITASELIRDLEALRA